MPVNPKSVSGRRVLTFNTLEDIVQDAERLAAGPNVRTLGNWSLSHLVEHLAKTIDNSIDGFESKAPWIVRMIGPLIKGGMLRNRMKPGINLPPAAVAVAFPDADSVSSAVDHLRRAVGRTQHERMQAPHPAFGRMNHEEWIQLHLRHSELHLSFAVPQP